MRMSSSMYEVFNWNSSPDPPLTPAKHKRASLSLPPTTDIFAVDDKSDSDTRRPMIQRVASGESWCLRSLQESRERSISVRLKNEYCLDPLSLVLFSTHSRRTLSLSLSLSLVFYAITFFFYFTTHFIDACHVHLTPQRAYPAYFLSLRSSFPDCMVLVSGGFYDLR